LKNLDVAWTVVRGRPNGQLCDQLSKNFLEILS
jgi:hypothetical protein